MGALKCCKLKQLEVQFELSSLRGNIDFPGKCRLVTSRGHCYAPAMKRHALILILGLSLCTSPSLVAANKKAAEPVSHSHPFSPSVEGSHTLVPLSLGLLDYYGHFGIGILGSALFRVANDLPIYAGFETGFDFLASYYYTWYTDGRTRSYVGMPLMGVGMYRFELPKVPRLHPYAALGIGPYISLSSGRGIVLELAVRPGISWQLKPGLALHGEVRFGVIGSGFFIEPLGGLTFLL